MDTIPKRSLFTYDSGMSDLSTSSLISLIETTSLCHAGLRHIPSMLSTLGEVASGARKALAGDTLLPPDGCG